MAEQPIQKILSESLYIRTADAMKEYMEKGTLTVIFSEDEVRKITIPESVKNLSIEQGWDYPTIVNMILAEYHIRSTRDDRDLKKDIISIINAYPKMNDKAKAELITYILKHIKESL